MNLEFHNEVVYVTPEMAAEWLEKNVVYASGEGLNGAGLVAHGFEIRVYSEFCHVISSCFHYTICIKYKQE